MLWLGQTSTKGTQPMKDSKKRKPARKLALHPETVRRLSSPKLDHVGGGVGPIKIGTIAEFSGGPQCTAGWACTMAMGCSVGCR
jgi:hypothetical protein